MHEILCLNAHCICSLGRKGCKRYVSCIYKCFSHTSHQYKIHVHVPSSPFMIDSLIEKRRYTYNYKIGRFDNGLKVKLIEVLNHFLPVRLKDKNIFSKLADFLIDKIKRYKVVEMFSASVTYKTNTYG